MFLWFLLRIIRDVDFAFKRRIIYAQTLAKTSKSSLLVTRIQLIASWQKIQNVFWLNYIRNYRLLIYRRWIAEFAQRTVQLLAWPNMRRRCLKYSSVTRLLQIVGLDFLSFLNFEILWSLFIHASVHSFEMSRNCLKWFAPIVVPSLISSGSFANKFY